MALLAPALLLTFIAAGESALWGDRRATLFVQDHLPAWLEPLTSATNFLGHFEVMAVIALAAAVILTFIRGISEAGFVVLGLSGWLANVTLKNLAESPRPPLELAEVTASGFGFPSGHVMGTTVVLATLAYVLFRHSSPRWQVAAGAAVALTAIITGLGRVHVGAHWPSDVLGAWLWAAVWFLAILTVWRIFSRSPRPNTLPPAAPQRPRAPSA